MNAYWLLLMSILFAVVVRSRVRVGALKCIVIIALAALSLPASRIATWVFDLLRYSGTTEFISMITCALPAGISIAGFIWAASRKRRAFDVLSTGYAAVGLIVAMGYVMILSYTEICERSASRGQDEVVLGEGPYVARILGKSWPGSVFDSASPE